MSQGARITVGPVAAFFAAAVVLYACGGGGGTGGTVTTATTTTSTGTGGATTTSTTTGGPNVQVTVEPANAVCFTDGQVQFTASVFGSPNTEVVWSVDSGIGTIDGDGLYTAPSFGTSAIVRATSVANPTKSGIANVSVRRRATIEFFASPFGLDGLPMHEVTDVSEDGATAVGYLFGTDSTPAYWTKSTGWVALPFPPGCDDAAVIYTSDGNWMVGIGEPVEGQSFAVRWNKGGLAEWLLDGQGQKLAIVTEPPDNIPIVCSTHATVVVGFGASGIWRWRPNLPVDGVPLTFLGCISSNGLVVGGSLGSAAAVWSDSTGLLLTGGGDRVLDLNTFGTVASGTQDVAQYTGEFFWNGTSTLWPGQNHLGMTPSGTWTMRSSPIEPSKFWSPTLGEVGILQHLYDNGLQTDLTGWDVQKACYASSDRRKIIGLLGNASNQTKWFYANIP